MLKKSQKMFQLKRNKNERAMGGSDANQTTPYKDLFAMYLLNDVVHSVSMYFACSVSDIILGVPHKGNKPILYRQIAIYISRRYGNVNYDELSEFFGRSRTTIIRTVSTVENRIIKKDTRYTTAVERILGQLTMLTKSHSQAILQSATSAVGSDAPRLTKPPSLGR